MAASAARLRALVEGLPIGVEAAGRCGVRITVLRREKRNAISIKAARGLARLFGALGDCEDVRVTFLAGAGDHFCCGVDLGDGGSGDQEADITTMAALFQSVATLPQLSVALVRGSALGAGLGLVAACDMALATPDARFACPEARVGLIPAVISPYIIAAIGRRPAVELFATAREIDAERARALGLVGAVLADAAELDCEAAAIAEAMEMVAPSAGRAAKRLCELAGRPIDAALVAESVRLSLGRLRHGEVAEGFRAFRQKRKPNWQGSTGRS